MPSTVSFFTELTRSLNCASVDSSLEPTSTSTAKIVNLSSSLRWRKVGQLFRRNMAFAVNDHDNITTPL